jgi:hypothetical protein
MKRLAIVALIAAFVIGSTPHVVCVARGARRGTTADRPKCPHCQRAENQEETRQKTSAPDLPGPEEGNCPCCEGVDAILVNSEGTSTPLSLAGYVFHVAPASLSVGVVDSLDDFSVFFPLPSSTCSPRSGRALILLLGHFLA